MRPREPVPAEQRLLFLKPFVARAEAGWIGLLDFYEYVDCPSVFHVSLDVPLSDSRIEEKRGRRSWR